MPESATQPRHGLRDPETINRESSRWIRAQAYSCSYYAAEPYAYAGYYEGMTVVPSSTVVTTAGIEAQCLLKRAGFDPGTIDGVFGTNSRAAAKRFQTMMNNSYGYTLATDGIVGSETWPALRTYVCYRT